MNKNENKNENNQVNASLMHDLSLVREKINGVDKQIQSLILERMSLVKEISDIKKRIGLSTYDRTREEEIYRRIKEDYASSPFLPILLSIQEELIKQSKLYQNKQ